MSQKVFHERIFSDSNFATQFATTQSYPYPYSKILTSSCNWPYGKPYRLPFTIQFQSFSLLGTWNLYCQQLFVAPTTTIALTFCSTTNKMAKGVDNNTHFRFNFKRHASPVIVIHPKYATTSTKANLQTNVPTTDTWYPRLQ